MEDGSVSSASVARTLDAIALFVRRFVVLSPAQAEAVALWILHTHAFEAADITPYLSVCSARKYVRVRRGSSRSWSSSCATRSPR